MRRPEDLRNAFSYRPPYYHFDDDVLNFVDYGPQNSRGFRALKVWLALQHIGRTGYVETIVEDIRLSRKLHELVLARRSCPTPSLTVSSRSGHASSTSGRRTRMLKRCRGCY